MPRKGSTLSQYIKYDDWYKLTVCFINTLKYDDWYKLRILWISVNLIIHYCFVISFQGLAPGHYSPDGIPVPPDSGPQSRHQSTSRTKGTLVNLLKVKHLCPV